MKKLTQEKKNREPEECQQKNNADFVGTKHQKANSSRDSSVNKMAKLQTLHPNGCFPKSGVLVSKGPKIDPPMSGRFQ